jgi:hypothetical protein
MTTFTRNLFATLVPQRFWKCALGSDRELYLASEGRPWNGGGRLIALRCTLP